LCIANKDKIDLKMRKQIAAGNWKMNTTVKEGVALLRQLSKEQMPADVEVIIGAPTTHLQSLVDLGLDQVQVAAQNCHHKTSGAYTGETSPTTLVDMGVPVVILGHSERREYANEDNALLKAKLDAALAAGLRAIFCCGEPLSIRKDGSQNDYVSDQISDSVFHLDADALSNVVIAYEPIWAIGTGETASPAQAQDMHKHIRGLFTAKYGADTAEKLSILYGGSVKPANAKELFGQPDVDGGLVGGASLKADGFGEIIRSFS